MSMTDHTQGEPWPPVDVGHYRRVVAANAETVREAAENLDHTLEAAIGAGATDDQLAAALEGRGHSIDGYLRTRWRDLR